MKIHLVLLLILSLGSVVPAWADPTPPSWDEKRLEGFAEHNKENEAAERQRLSGKTKHRDRINHEDEKRLKALNEYRQEAKQQSPREGGRENKLDDIQKKKVIDAYKATREKYIQEKARMLARKNSNTHLVTPNQELGLNVDLPRFEISKRAMYGGKPGNGVAGRSSGGGGGAGGGPSFPTNPPFEESGGGMPNNGYYPPPEIGMGGEENGENFGVPPPPAPTFEEGDFPPPPPIPEEYPAPPMGFPPPDVGP